MNKVLEIPALHPHGKGYRIRFDSPLSSPGFQSLPKEKAALFEELYVKIQEAPRKHIRRLKELHRDCPSVPEIANLLTYGFLKLKKKRCAEELIAAAYRANPDHLIAKINYADQAIRLGNKALVPQIFNGAFDLNALCPDRDSFHYAEFRGFMTTLGFYYYENEEREKAEECYQLAFQVDPLHPAVAALEKKLSGRSLKKWLRSLQKLARISKNP